MVGSLEECIIVDNFDGNKGYIRGSTEEHPVVELDGTHYLLIQWGPLNSVSAYGLSDIDDELDEARGTLVRDSTFVSKLERLYLDGCNRNAQSEGGLNDELLDQTPKGKEYLESRS